MITQRRVVALAVALLLTLTLPGTGVSSPTAAPSPGASGIGDRYFPLDGNGGYDVAHYDVRNRYRMRSGRLTGRTAVTATATHALTSFHLDLLLPVRSVSVDGRRARFSRPNRHELRVVPPRPLPEGARFTVVVRYAGFPARLGWRGERNWLANGREVVTMNQPHMAAWWFPSNDHPRDKARMDVRITVPRGNQVVANGALVGRRAGQRGVTWHWRSRDPMAPYLAFFAAGRFRLAHGISGGLPWVAAVSRALPRSAQRSSMRQLRRSPGLVRWLESQVGPYPFESTGGVVTALPVGFALENQTRPTYPAVRGEFGRLLVHELAHQWFGNHVAVGGWQHIWLSEGLATFFEQRYAETHGGPSASSWLAATHAAAPESFWRLRIGDPGSRRMFDRAVYVRGGMTIQALRQRIGEEQFWRLLRTWLARFGGSHADTADFRALAEEVSGQRLDGFFAAWLDTPMRPAATAENGLRAP